MVLWGYEIERGDIQKYFTKEIDEQLEVYAYYCKFGFPYIGGWAEQPAVFIDICSTLIDEGNKRAKRNGTSQHTS